MGSAVIQGPGGCRCGCVATILGKATGCNGSAVPGLTVEAHDATAGGTLLGTATTNGTGDYTLTAAGATSGNNIVIIFVSPRYATANRTLAYTSGTVGNTAWKCGATTPTATSPLAAASGYECTTCCPNPWPDTLHISDSLVGAATLTWNGAKGWWEGAEAPYSFPGCTYFGGSTCPAATVTVHFLIDHASALPSDIEK